MTFTALDQPSMRAFVNALPILYQKIASAVRIGYSRCAIAMTVIGFVAFSRSSSTCSERVGTLEAGHVHWQEPGIYPVVNVLVILGDGV